MSDSLNLNRRHVLAGLAAAPFAVTPFSALAQANETVRIANTSGNTTLTLQKLMERKGFFAQQKINAETVNIADGSKLMGALLSDAADVSINAGFGQVLTAIEKGAKLKVIAGSMMTPFHAIYSKKPDIKTVADMKGKVIGIGSLGSVLHSMMVAILRKNNIADSDVTFVNIGSNVDVFRAVVAGTIDAGASEVDFYFQQDKYGVHALQGGELWKELPNFTFQAAFTSDALIAKRRDALVRTLAATAQLYRYALTDASRDDFFASRADALGKNDAEEAKTQWEFHRSNKSYATDLVVSEERIRYMQELNVAVGAQKKVLPYEQVVDMSIARDALKLIG